MRQFYQRINELLNQNQTPFAICSVIETKGSTPRNSGKMIVYPDGRSEFTIGGGPAEKASIDAAVEALETGKSGIFEWILNKEHQNGLNSTCGGQMKVFIEVYQKRSTLAIIGAGHVNLALAKLANGLDFEVLVIDDRESSMEDPRFAFAKQIVVESDIYEAVQQALPLLDENTFVVVATKDNDPGAISALNGLKLPYIGLIGSQRKILKLRERLTDEGASQDWLDGIYMPIGLDIGAETPEELAISIWAEILAIKNGREPRSMQAKQVERQKTGEVL